MDYYKLAYSYGDKLTMPNILVSYAESLIQMKNYNEALAKIQKLLII